MKAHFEPFNEEDDLRHLKWKNEDPTDKYIPSTKGFITDFVYSTRGREVTSAYAVWGALYMISSVLQRDSYFLPPDGDSWLDRDYLNMYTLLIGPAGSGKSASINVIQKVLSGVNKAFKENENVKMKIKEFAQISDASTPEAFIKQMSQQSMVSHKAEDGVTHSQRKVAVGQGNDGPATQLKHWSNANAMLSEFSSLLNKKKYNESMSATLLTLYDCPEMYKSSTIGRGVTTLPEVHLNIIGASTADGMTSSVDPKALEDGFMSRVIMVYVPDYVRRRPTRFKTDCTTGTIIHRLTWIAENAGGQYTFSKEAERWFASWYNNFMDNMNKNPEKAGYMIRNRVLIIKLAILLMISEYKTSKSIEVKYLKEASKLIKTTYGEVADLIGYFTDAQLGATRRALEASLLNVKSGLTRQQLARKLSRFRDESVDSALKTLYLRGQVTVIDDAGEEKSDMHFYPKERYIYERINGRLTKENVDLYGEGESSISEGSTSYTDSKGSEQEPVGNLLDPEEGWSGHFPRDQGKEA